MRTQTLFLLLAAVIVTSGCLSETQPEEQEGVSTFDSEQEFIQYMEQSSVAGETGSTSDYGGAVVEESTEEIDTERDLAEDDGQGTVEAAEWIQTSNDTIFVSHRYPRHFQSVELPELGLEHNLSEVGGPSVVSDGSLIMEESDRIVSYDSEMNEDWEQELDSRVEEMKLSGDQLILLTRENSVECPVRPMHDVEVSCSSIVRPGYTGQSDFTYTLTTLDTVTGDEVESMSFVASSRTEVDVTPEETFISYTERTPDHEIMTDFLLNEASITGDTHERVEELQGYDLTPRSMEIEIEAVITENEDMEELEEEFNQYDRENLREYEESTLMIVDNEDLSIEERTFDGAISSIDSGIETVLEIEYNGVEWDNSEKEIRILDGASRELDGDARIFNEQILIEESEELKLLNFELEEVSSESIEALTVETFDDKILVSVRHDEVSQLVLFDSELNRLDSKRFESRALWGFEPVGEETGYTLVSGRENNTLLEITDQIKVFETDASGTLVYESGLYSVSDKVQRISNTGEIEDELELEVPRMMRPMPEPIPR